MSTPPEVIQLQGKFDVREVNELYRTVAALGRPVESGRCRLDLADVSFMAPVGLTGLIQAVVHLRSEGWSTTVNFPTSGGVAMYLVRMGFKRALRGRGRCLGAPPSKKRYAASTALVELTAIQDSGDVDDLLHRLTDRVGGILEQELGYSEGDIGNFTNVISELCRNIIDHSGAIGFVAAQRYRQADGQRFALISVGDTGLGLRATLGQRYPVDSWSEETVLVRALLPEYSRHPNRGFGLTFVKKVCQDYRGSLYVRSGAGQLYIRGRKLLSFDVGWFPGTQISISLAQRDGA